ncbi:unnamed protein product [Phytophthora fragariaefolia]|uniref:Unnamed protein product n=1 Tax=Phytophthora fragariaefolia TaxID=1490495 RepID=A0A9W6XDW6_9STRA|nr:unnamed protein product [Phytophthora fragariaefolia]
MHTRKYRDWQVLAFAAATDGQLSDKERLLYEEWLAQQPPAVERRQYAAPGGVRSRPLDAPHGPTCEEQWKQLDELTDTYDETANGVIDEVSSNQADSSISEEVNASVAGLHIQTTFTLVQHALMDCRVGTRQIFAQMYKGTLRRQHPPSHNSSVGLSGKVKNPKALLHTRSSG